MKKKVLIIDDEEIICHFLNRLIDMLGCEVVVANDGEKAIEVLKKEKFDLIFLDVRIPKISGYEIFNSLDNDSKKKVVIFSGDVLSPELYQFVNENNIKLLKKPATFDEIKEIIEKI